MKTKNENLVFMWINLQNFIVFNSEGLRLNVCNTIVAIGHQGKKNIIIDPTYSDDTNDAIDLIEINLNDKIRIDWVVKYGDGFSIDTWDNKLLKTYSLIEK